MTNVTHLNPPQHGTGVERPALTTAHRSALTLIQDLAIDVSQQTDLAVTAAYHGYVHCLEVSIMPYRHGHPSRGGDSSYKATWRADVYLPPHPLSPPDALKQLGAIIRHLQTLLGRTGGAA